MLGVKIMAKYVQFNFEDKEPEYYNVDDFSLETIKKLPSYNEKWFKMTFLDGKIWHFCEYLFISS